MPLRTKTVEEDELPRWVYAMMKANEDPNAEQDDSGDVKKRMLAQLKAQDFYKLRQQRMKEMAEQQGTSSRLSGLEWKNRPKNKFTAEELKKVLPTTDPVYMIKKTILVSFVGSILAAVTGTLLFATMSFCAELKLGGDYHNLGHNLQGAWAMFLADPSAYYHRVISALGW